MRAKRGNLFEFSDSSLLSCPVVRKQEAWTCARVLVPMMYELYRNVGTLCTE